MKLTKLFALVSILCVSGALSKSYAQVDVTINPIGILFGDLSAGADFNLGENLSVEAAVGFGSGKQSGTKYSAIPLTGTFKYYFNPDKGCDKFYADAFVKFINRKYEYDDSSLGFANYTQTRFGFGLGIGFKAVSKKGIVFDIGLGAGRAIVDNTKYEDSNGIEETVDWPDLMIQGKIGIGYRFGGK